MQDLELEKTRAPSSVLRYVLPKATRRFDLRRSRKRAVPFAMCNGLCTDTD